jgi:hypothetical protein
LLPQERSMAHEGVWSIEVVTGAEWEQIGWSEYKAHAYDIFSAAIRASPHDTVRLIDPDGKVLAQHVPRKQTGKPPSRG